MDDEKKINNNMDEILVKTEELKNTIADSERKIEEKMKALPQEKPQTASRRRSHRPPVKKSRNGIEREKNVEDLFEKAIRRSRAQEEVVEPEPAAVPDDDLIAENQIEDQAVPSPETEGMDIPSFEELANAAPAATEEEPAAEREMEEISKEEPVQVVTPDEKPVGEVSFDEEELHEEASDDAIGKERSATEKLDVIDHPLRMEGATEPAPMPETAGLWDDAITPLQPLHMDEVAVPESKETEPAPVAVEKPEMEAAPETPEAVEEEPVPAQNENPFADIISPVTAPPIGEADLDGVAPATYTYDKDASIDERLRTDGESAINPDAMDAFFAMSDKEEEIPSLFNQAPKADQPGQTVKIQPEMPVMETEPAAAAETKAPSVTESIPAEALEELPEAHVQQGFESLGGSSAAPREVVEPAVDESERKLEEENKPAPAEEPAEAAAEAVQPAEESDLWTVDDFFGDADAAEEPAKAVEESEDEDALLDEEEDWSDNLFEEEDLLKKRKSWMMKQLGMKRLQQQIQPHRAQQNRKQRPKRMKPRIPKIVYQI